MVTVSHDDRRALASGLAAQVADDLEAALAAGPAAIAVPGGTTPEPFLKALFAIDLDWDRVTVMATDERWTPPSDARSNEGMIRRAMSRGAFLPFWRDGVSAADAVDDVGATVAPHLPLAACVMGMGTDMHCASLFPGAEALAEALSEDADPIMAIAAPGAPEPRITLTAPALCGAGGTYLLITGEEKRDVLNAALGEPDALRAPVADVLRRARKAEIHWAP